MHQYFNLNCNSLNYCDVISHLFCGDEMVQKSTNELRFYPYSFIAKYPIILYGTEIHMISIY